MKNLIVIALTLLSVNTYAVENKNVECSLTRYIPIIGADGHKNGGETKGTERAVLKWVDAANSSQSASAEIEGVSLSASLSTSTCWDDDRQVECNQRYLFFYILNRKDGSNVSTGYYLNSMVGGQPMSIVLMNSGGRYEISCKQ
jgi:hypothetical protein